MMKAVADKCSQITSTRKAGFINKAVDGAEFVLYSFFSQYSLFVLF